MRIAEIKIYQYDELSGEAQINAREWFSYNREINLDYEIEYWIEYLDGEGFHAALIYYSGFFCQGDGASFTAEVDKKHFLVGKYAVLEGVDFEFKIGSFNSNYCHSRTKEIVSYIYQATEQETDLIIELEKEIEQHRQCLCEKIYQALEKQYEHETSDEVIAEIIKNNEYEFTEEGKKW